MVQPAALCRRNPVYVAVTKPWTTKARNAQFGSSVFRARHGLSLQVTTYPTINATLLVVGATLSTAAVAGTYVWPGGAVTETWAWLVDGASVAGSYVIQPGDVQIEADVTLTAPGLPAGTVLHVGPVSVQNSAPVAGDVTLTGTVAAGTATAPAAMAAPTVTTTATRITITKAADPSNGGSAITDYDYRTSTDGGSTWSAWSALTSPQTVAGFTPGSTTVQVQTRANNAVGKGATGTAASATMKVVTFVGYAKITGTGASMTIDMTTLLTDVGSPAPPGGAILKDDVIFVLAGWATSSTNVDVQVTGYTEIDDLFDGTTRAVNLAVAWKAQGATPDTSITSNASNSAGNGSAAMAMVMRYVDPTTPLDVAYVSGTHSATAAGNALANSPPITPVSPGAFIVSYVAATGDTTPAPLTISGMTKYGEAGMGGTSRGYRLAAAHKTDWVSGAFDPPAWTTSESAASDSWAAVTLAFKPY